MLILIQEKRLQDVLQGSGRYVDSLNKVGKLNDRTSRLDNESDISTTKGTGMGDNKFKV